MDNNIRTMKFIGEDDWGHDIYKCLDSGILYKDGSDLSFEGHKPELYSCGNEIDGELCFPIKKDFEIHFIEREPQPTKEEKFNYQMLARLKMDCDYYLGNGNRYANHLWAGNEQEQIKEMKKLYNIFPDDKKPEWLTYEQILKYEESMIF
jgi:hypothetical protein